ncbi:hypothetical protein Syun_017966 [Stephania yunnanensis]|uniref:Uncharacterized protein n=1 Tax=Stephania yunnanensis TaxID=152371 RepID=A0AAP0IRJ2_9MAGN
MEMEVEACAKPLNFKIKGMSRESSPAQKALNVLDTDLRNHWSTGTNTKEWILLELDEPCLLSHIRIYNKSVLEWEIAVGLRYKVLEPEAFAKIRPRCEAPRRDIMYPMNYTPCRYVRISCLRGNPIAIFFIQLIGVPIPGLEPEFQPVVNHLLPQIIAHKQDDHNMYLQLLQDMTNRLAVFLPQLEADLASFPEAAESSTLYLAMLAGPFYPILHIVNEREARVSGGLLDSDASRSTQATTLTVSSNFEVILGTGSDHLQAQPKRARSPSPFVQPASASNVFRPDSVFMLLRKANKDPHLGIVCRTASRALHELIEPAVSQESVLVLIDQASSLVDEVVNAEGSKYFPLVDYSSLFGEDFSIPDINCDSSYLNVLDIGATEEGILHILYACASQIVLSSFGLFYPDSSTAARVHLDLALRPPVSGPSDHVDDSFSQWKQPFVQQALSQIIATLSSSVYRSLLHACSGYLSSYSPSHAKAACVLIDLCSGPLAPWISTVVAKVDLAMELLEELLGTIQGSLYSVTRAQAAIKYVILALSGHMDDVLPKYKVVKHKILFLIEMLEPFLDPVISAMKNTIAFGDVSAIFLEKQEHNCAIALNIIHTAVQKPAVLSALESEWKRGSVAPSTSPIPSTLRHSGLSQEDSNGKSDTSEAASKFDISEDCSLFFAPAELKNMALRTLSNILEGQSLGRSTVEPSKGDASKDGKHPMEDNLNNHLLSDIVLDVGFAVEYFNFQADFLQLMNHRDGELRSSEFRRLALDNSADAVTLVRQNQALLCHFLIQHLQKEKHSMHEILMQSLLFFLRSATEIFCPPEHVIDIILGSAEFLNRLLTSFYYQVKQGNMQLDSEKVYGVQRRWAILQNLAIVSSTGEEPDFIISNSSGYQYRSLIPLSYWLQKLPEFASSPYPLVRFLGWMAISRYAKQYLRERLFLASDMSQLSYLLSIFADELAQGDNIVKDGMAEVRQTGNGKDFDEKKLLELTEGSFAVLYPDLHNFFPSMKRRFEAFGEVILEAVGSQLKSFPSSVIPDILCWFSDLCLCPFLERVKDGQPIAKRSDKLKGYSAKNARAIILYTLEAIVVEHMESMVPEIPRVVQVLVSLCRASYCDVSFLDSILCLLRPLISYALRKMSDDEKMLMDGSSCLNFESLCFDELLSNIKCRSDNQEGTEKRFYGGALTIYVLGTLLPDLSFQWQMEILESVVLWADFTTEPAHTFFDYLCGFQKVIDSCKLVVSQILCGRGIQVLQYPSNEHEVSGTELDFATVASDISEVPSSFQDVSCDNTSPTMFSSRFEDGEANVHVSSQRCALTTEEIDEFSQSLIALIDKLCPTIDKCWKLHHQLAMKLTFTSAWCYMYSRCFASIVQRVSINVEDASDSVSESNANCLNSINWRSGLEGLAGAVVTLQQNHYWQVASAMLDYLLGLPKTFVLGSMLGTICSAIKHFCCHAPRILWRLQTDKWLPILLTRGIDTVQDDLVALVDLFHVMLNHPEPEQRSVALQHLGSLDAKEANGEKLKFSCTSDEDLGATDLKYSVSESVLSILVSRTWDRVVLLVSSDPSILLRIRAMVLLANFITYAERTQLQSFLCEADTIFHGLGKLGYCVCESPLTQISLALLAGICLYSPAEDISMIPQSVWRNLEGLGMSTGGKIGDMEKEVCQALCKLRTNEDEAKVVLKKLFSSGSASKKSDPEFGSTRESILQVVKNLTSVQAYLDMFSKRIDREAMELEEAEIEMDLLQKEHAPKELSGDNKEASVLSTGMNDKNRLQQIKDEICSFEKSKLREEIAARRQKKLLLRRTRHKCLEEAALREAELLKELDRERTVEMEREIERQRLLEVERAKTRELRYNLDMEKERQMHMELQRELEQAESGLRPSRREFSSSTPNRPRDRYRERENGRSIQDGSLRAGSSGRESSVAPPSTTGSAMPTIVLSGSRQFSGQLPTILQSRDRPEERGTSYEDNFEGSKDSGDTGSVGESDLASVFDGQPGSFGSSQRHSSRGSKSRQMMERRERDGRREGKWERKH